MLFAAGNERGSRGICRDDFGCRTGFRFEDAVLRWARPGWRFAIFELAARFLLAFFVLPISGSPFLITCGI